MKMLTCKYGNHECDPLHVCYYTDLKNGIAEDTLTCNSCYERHILKFYPKSKIARHLTQRGADSLKAVVISPPKSIQLEMVLPA